MKKRILILGLTACLLAGAVLMTGCTRTEEENKAIQSKAQWQQQTDEQRLKVYFDLTRESLLLKEKLGDTPYITMLRSVKGNMITSGMTKAQAIDNAAELIIEEQALVWYAEKNGIKVTDKEVADYIKTNVIEEVRQDEDFSKMEDACSKAGMTFEDSIWAYENSYKSAYIVSKIENYSDKLMDEIKKDYKKSSAYEKDAAVIGNCKNLIAAGETDNKVLQSADIYFK